MIPLYNKFYFNNYLIQINANKLKFYFSCLKCSKQTFLNINIIMRSTAKLNINNKIRSTVKLIKNNKTKLWTLIWMYKALKWRWIFMVHKKIMIRWKTTLCIYLNKIKFSSNSLHNQFIYRLKNKNVVRSLAK